MKEEDLTFTPLTSASGTKPYTYPSKSALLQVNGKFPESCLRVLSELARLGLDSALMGSLLAAISGGRIIGHEVSYGL